uniref:UspA domain-containing protein n=1 Tax=Aegilops tauschii subsp. strangulata TaxID=200361 RepID=A0A453LSU0_AEGTS
RGLGDGEGRGAWSRRCGGRPGGGHDEGGGGGGRERGEPARAVVGARQRRPAPPRRVRRRPPRPAPRRPLRRPRHLVRVEAGLAYAPPTALDSMRRAQEENSRRVVARALDVCRQKQASATAAVVEGDPKEAIYQAVEEMRADLLVLGSRGLGMIKRALLGSVSDYLAHHACCPVLIVKPPNKAHHK